MDLEYRESRRYKSSLRRENPGGKQKRENMLLYMDFCLKNEYQILLDKHSAFFEHMRSQNFCILDEFVSCSRRYPTKADDYFNALPHDAVIAVCGVGVYARALFDALSGYNQNRISYYVCADGSHEGLMFNGQNVLSPSELKAKHVDFIILASIDFKYEMRKYLLKAGFGKEKLLDIDLNFKDICERGVCLSTDKNYCSSCRQADILVLHYDISVMFAYYESSLFFNDARKKIEALFSLLSGFIAGRDIVNIRKYANEYIEKKYPAYELLEAYLLDLNNLMELARSKIKARKQDVIVIYLFDAYEYHYLEHMPNLEKQYHKSLIFNSAFTQYGYTTSTLQVMFTGMDLIDEKAYEVFNFTEENSPLIQTIKDGGYKLHVFRNDARISLFQNSPFVCHHLAECFASGHFFEMLNALSSRDERQILFTHLFETHPPFFSPFNIEIEQSDFLKANAYNTSLNRLVFGRLSKSLNYLDGQFAFFDDFLPEKATRVVMSDHGAGAYKIPEHVSSNSCYQSYDNDFLQNTHVTLFVSGPQIKHGVVDELFCLKDFDKLLRFMWGQTGLESLAAPYIKLQILPTYNLRHLNELDKKSKPLLLPHRGIISSDGVYIYDYDGNEFFYPNKPFNHINDPIYSSVVNKMRKLCGTDFHGLFEHPKFADAKQRYLEKGLISE